MLMRWKNSKEDIEKGPLMKKKEKTEEKIKGDFGEGAAIASVVEGLVGALYLESGIGVARKFIEAHFLSRQIDLKAHVDLYLKLQEPRLLLWRICKKNELAPPVARLLKETGKYSSSPVFIVGMFSGVNQIGEGYGSSKKMAEIKVNNIYCF